MGFLGVNGIGYDAKKMYKLALKTKTLEKKIRTSLYNRAHRILEFTTIPAEGHAILSP